MFKKHFILVAFLVTFLLIMVGCGAVNEGDANENSESNTSEGNNTDEETITLKFATDAPVDAAVSKQAAEPVMERITELTDGRVQFEYYPAEQLGKVGDLLSLTRDGVTDIGYIGTPYFPSELPLTNTVTGLPGLYERGEQGSLAYYNVMLQEPMLETDYLSNGIRPFLVLMTPTYDLFTTGKEVKVPEDLKGMKIRGAGGVLSEGLDYAGATVVQMPSPEIYEALDRGVVDGIHQYTSTLESYGAGELITHGTRGIGFSGGAIVYAINEEVFQDLPVDIQEAITQAGREISESSGLLHQEDSDKVFEEWIQSGVNIHEPTEDELQEWNNFYDEFIEYWSEEQDSEDFDKVLEQFIEEVEKQK